MGFSLEGMFTELNGIINNSSLDEKERLTKLEEEIAWWRVYAIECGQMKK